MFNIQFTPQGKDDLERLPKDIQKRIIKKLQFYSSLENPLLFSTLLRNLPPMTHRFRVGDYRIAFYIKKGSLYIHRVRHRRHVYKLI